MQEGSKKAEPFILFQLAGATYGIRSREVRQVEMVENITPVPEAPSCLEGIIFSRGQVIPAINLRVRFGFERIPHDVRTRLIVVGEGDRSVGLIVDSAREFATIPEEEIKPPPEEISGLSGNYLEGVVTKGDRLILVLDIGAVLDLTKVEELRTTTEVSSGTE